MTTHDYAASLAKSTVSEHLRGGLLRYVEHHIRPGDFLEAVLRNDLFEAMSRADDDSVAGLRGLCMWIYNEAPGQCWGSPALVKAWLALRVERPVVDE